MPKRDVESEWRYYPPTAFTIEKYEQVRERFQALADFIENNIPVTEETKQAHLRLQEAAFWSNAAIARHLTVARHWPMGD